MTLPAYRESCHETHKGDEVFCVLEGVVSVIILDEKVSEIATLYEITKQMSSTLSFVEIFGIFSAFLKRNFKFITCKLILLDKDRRRIAKIYKIDTHAGEQDSAKAEVATHELIDAEILNEILRDKRTISWEDFIAIPLISQGEIMGILNVEGLEETSLEKFLIVARQFSLEIERVRLYETVQALAVTDGLTEIFVRRYFLELFKDEFERSLRHSFKLSFLMADLDHFKECNDRFGHLVGDAVLKGVACALRQNVREIDILARYGGEEFSLLLPEADKRSALAVAERLRNAIAQQEFKAYDERVGMTISIGVSTFPDDAKNISGLIESADAALYKAKAGGRNRVVGFKKEGL
jgi:diguanylate cyclase (GGDEF)-like protein